MVFKDSLESIIEAVYLNETLGKDVGKFDIKVNPKLERLEIDYTFNKIIIVTDNYVEQKTIDKLYENGNTIISRVSGYNNVLLQPYITYINFNVMWSGEILKCPPEIKDNSRKILEWVGNCDDFDCDPEKSIELYFPKIEGIGLKALYDEKENITSLGWIMHQVGINIDKKTNFIDLDLIKTKKIIK